jgi:myo-inositol-1(or 4)-monophosphatase
VRRLGSAAIDLCYVAAGRMDGFWEADLKPWDIAAGALLVAEAGGRVTTTGGEPFTSRGGQVLATNGHLHGAMLDVITDFRGRRAPKRTQ